MPTADPVTGEFRDEGEIALVPLNIADLDEDALRELLPTPVQAAGALVIARERLANAPGALNSLAATVRQRKRELTVARGYAFRDLRSEGFSQMESKIRAESEPEVLKAAEALDDAELAMQYGQDLKWVLGKEVELLRSLNANVREEHR